MRNGSIAHVSNVYQKEIDRLKAENQRLREVLQNIEANLTGQDCRAERIADSLRRATEALGGEK